MFPRSKIVSYAILCCSCSVTSYCCEVMYDSNIKYTNSKKYRSWQFVIFSSTRLSTTDAPLSVALYTLPLAKKREIISSSDGLCYLACFFIHCRCCLLLLVLLLPTTTAAE